MCAFSLILTSMTLIIAFELERPEIALHGLFAARLVFLRLEGLLVGGDLGQIFCTSCYRSGDGAEFSAVIQFGLGIFSIIL